MDDFVQISDWPALTGLIANMCADHDTFNDSAAIRNKQAEAEK
jgi:hypothetical protein